MTTKKKTFEWRKTARKVSILLAEIFIAGVIYYVTENLPAAVGSLPVLHAIQDWIKHRSR